MKKKPVKPKWTILVSHGKKEVALFKGDTLLDVMNTTALYLERCKQNE